MKRNFKKNRNANWFLGSLVFILSIPFYIFLLLFKWFSYITKEKQTYSQIDNFIISENFYEIKINEFIRGIKFWSMFQAIFFFVVLYLSFKSYKFFLGFKQISIKFMFLDGVLIGRILFIAILLLIFSAAIIFYTRTFKEKKGLLKKINQFSKGKEAEDKIYNKIAQKLLYPLKLYRNVMSDSGDIDFLIIGKNAYIVDVKSHKGIINFKKGTLFINGKPFEKNLINQIQQNINFIFNKIKKETFGVLCFESSYPFDFEATPSWLILATDINIIDKILEKEKVLGEKDG